MDALRHGLCRLYHTLLAPFGARSPPLRRLLDRRFEVGLGGRFDATNAITPIVSVITPISMDHMNLLGDTLQQIAFEKAGIIKSDVPIVSAPQKPAALEVIVRFAEERHAPLFLVDNQLDFQVTAASLSGQEFHKNAGFDQFELVAACDVNREQAELLAQSARENQGANVSFTYTLKSSLINEIRWGVAYNDQPRHGAQNGLQLVKELGLVGLAPNLPDIAGILQLNWTGIGIQNLTQQVWRHPGFKNKFNQVQEARGCRVPALITAQVTELGVV